MRRLAAVITAAVLVVGCHGEVSVRDFWYLDQYACGDNSAAIRLYQPDPGASYMVGTTGYFWPYNNCQDGQPSQANMIRAQVALYKTSTGLCWAGPPYAFNPQGAFYATSNPNIGTRICNDGYYYARTSSGIAFSGPGTTWTNDPNGLNSPQDYVCYHNPCQG